MLIELLVGLIILGVAWWAIQFIGLPAPIDRIAQVILVVVAVLWMLGLLFGLDYGLDTGLTAR